MPRPAATIALRAAFVLALAACGSTAVLGAESRTAASARYRLTIEKPAEFRLATSGSNAPAPGASEAPAIAPQFADKPFARLIDGAAREAALDPALVHAVIAVESAYNQKARSPKGAIGLMQVMPATASRYGVADPSKSPEANLRAGTRYLSELMELFENRLDLVLAAYNAGENAVLRYGQRIPPFRETQQYVPAVLAKYREWQEPPPPVAPAPAYIEYMPGTRLDLKALRGADER